MRKEKPTVEDITGQLYPKCKEFYAFLRSQFEENEKYYELDFKSLLGLPIEFEADGIVLPTIRDMLDGFTDHIDIGNARVSVDRKGVFNVSAERAETMRRFYVGTINITNIEADISPWRVLAKHYPLHGLGVCKTVWDADRWPDKPERKEGESDKQYDERIQEWQSQTYETFPIAIQAVHPRCILPDPSYGGRMFIMEEHERLCLDVSTRWPHWSNPKGKKLSDTVDLLSYWDANYRCELIDGEPVLKVKGGVAQHHYGFIPYVLLDSGLGNISYDNDPKKRYVGLGTYMKDLAISESLIYSLCNILTKRETMKGGYITGADAEAVAEVSQAYGKYWPIGNKDVEFHDWESKMPSQEAYAHLALTHDYMSKHGTPPSLRGLPAEGVRSAAHFRLMTGEAATRFRYSEDAFKYRSAKILTNCARIFKNVVPGDIRVWARGAPPQSGFDEVIRKDEMKEPFICYVEFAPISEEDEYRRHDDLIRLVQGGIVTPQWARTQMSNVDSLALDEQEEREKIKNSPAFLAAREQYIAVESAKAFGTRIAAEAMQAEQQATPEERMGGMTTGVPKRAPPGSAEDIQNRLKAQRSQTPIYPGQGQGGGGRRYG